MTPKRDDAARLLFGVVVLLVLETVGRCSLSWLFGSSTWKTGGTWSSACQVGPGGGRPRHARA